MNAPTKLVTQAIKDAATGQISDPERFAAAIIIALDNLPMGTEVLRDSCKVMLAALCAGAGLDPEKADRLMSEAGHSPLPMGVSIVVRPEENLNNVMN